MDDPFDLERFVQAQDPVLASVQAELRAGRKRTHWMWFVFPQLRALGHSAMAHRYGIASLAEARAYRDHRRLWPRLIECTALVCAVPGRSIHEILGSPDDRKFQSCMTLFAAADPAEALFSKALDRFYGGSTDPQTIDLLAPR